MSRVRTRGSPPGDQERRWHSLVPIILGRVLLLTHAAIYHSQTACQGVKPYYPTTYKVIPYLSDELDTSFAVGGLTESREAQQTSERGIR